MIPKGRRRHSVKAEYRAARTAATEMEAAREQAAFEAAGEIVNEDEVEIAGVPDTEPVAAVEIPDQLIADSADANRRLDAVLAQRIAGISRARVQMWIERGGVLVNDEVVRASHKLHAGDRIRIEGDLAPAPLKAEPENIPLDIIYEDDDLAVINKPAGMMVHAGNGATEEATHRGTLVNALLHHFSQLSAVGGALRPGIVHRLDKETSGLILVAKNDVAHRRLSEMFSERKMQKTYIALVHGVVKLDSGTINAPITRDAVRRTRMKALTSNYETKSARNAVTHYRVMERIDSPWGRFTLLEVRIETGRTHQIRVHMSSIGHPVVGDVLYGAPREILPAKNAVKKPQIEALHLERNFLHAARLVFSHPTSKREMKLEAPLPPELNTFLNRLREK
jgi:23S rRNA pseudouridine1911/1915/1917 synthase